jgi:integrase
MRFDDLDIETLRIPTGRQKQSYTSARVKGLMLLLIRGSDRRIRREFHLRYTRPGGGGRTSLFLGLWPDIDADQAVELAKENRALIRRGIDPVAQSRLIRTKAHRDQFLSGQAVDERFRLSAITAEFLAEAEQTRNPRTLAKYRQAFVHYLLPEHGGCDVRYFDRATFEQHVRVLGRRSRAAARNLFAVTRLLFNWAVEHDRIHANPLAGRRTLLHEIELRPRDRVLSSEELHRFVNELDDQPISGDAKVLLRLQLLVGTRAGELAGLLWSEVDFRARVARLPAERMKSKRDAEVVLSDAARRLLLEWRRETLPLGRSRVFVEGLDIHALVREVRRLREWIAFSSHDLRRTVRSQLQRLGCPLEIRSLISNHTPPSGVARHYDHAKVRREQLRWLEHWAAALATVAEDPQALTDELERADDALLAEFADVL